MVWLPPVCLFLNLLLPRRRTEGQAGGGLVAASCPGLSAESPLCPASVCPCPWACPQSAPGPDLHHCPPCLQAPWVPLGSDSVMDCQKIDLRGEGMGVYESVSVIMPGCLLNKSIFQLFAYLLEIDNCPECLSAKFPM